MVLSMRTKSLTENRFLTKLDVAKRLGISRATVDIWRKADPTFPKPVVLSAFILRWDIEEVDAWAIAKKPSADESQNA